MCSKYCAITDSLTLNFVHFDLHLSILTPDFSSWPSFFYYLAFPWSLLRKPNGNPSATGCREEYCCHIFFSQCSFEQYTIYKWHNKPPRPFKWYNKPPRSLSSTTPLSHSGKPSVYNLQEKPWVPIRPHCCKGEQLLTNTLTFYTQTFPLFVVC